MKHQCGWCSKESPNLRPIQVRFRGEERELNVCSNDCESRLRHFLNYVESNFKLYVMGLLLAFLTGIVVTFARLAVDYGALGVLITLAGSGAVLVKYPFVTPQTTALLGMKRAIKSGQILGYINIFLGIAFAAMLLAIKIFEE